VRKTSIQPRELLVTDDVLCNQCGKSMRCDWHGCKDHFRGLNDAGIEGGYCSKDLEDLTVYEFDLCEKCLKKMFKSFKIPVTKQVLPFNY
jgi:hypothetical protein